MCGSTPKDGWSSGDLSGEYHDFRRTDKKEGFWNNNEASEYCALGKAAIRMGVSPQEVDEIAVPLKMAMRHTTRAISEGRETGRMLVEAIRSSLSRRMGNFTMKSLVELSDPSYIEA
jgi:hypothetical protein